MNLAEEREASRGRREWDYDRRMAGHLLSARIPPGASLKEIRTYLEEEAKYNREHIDRLMPHITELRAERKVSTMNRRSPDLIAQLEEMRKWLFIYMEKHPDATAREAFDDAQKELDELPCSFDTFRTGYFYRVRTDVRKHLGLPSLERPREKKKTPAEEKKEEAVEVEERPDVLAGGEGEEEPEKKGPLEQKKEDLERDIARKAMEEQDEEAQEAEKEGGRPSPMAEGLAGVVAAVSPVVEDLNEAQEEAEDLTRKHLPIPPEGGGVGTIPGEGAGLIGADVLPENWDPTDMTMRIDAPRGRLLFAVSRDVGPSLEVAAKDMDAFHALLEWIEKLLPIITDSGRAQDQE